MHKSSILQSMVQWSNRQSSCKIRFTGVESARQITPPVRDGRRGRRATLEEKLPSRRFLQARRPAPISLLSCVTTNPSLRNRFLLRIRRAPGRKTKTPDIFVSVSIMTYYDRAPHAQEARIGTGRVLWRTQSL
jgi:hypothetical protein